MKGVVKINKAEIEQEPIEIERNQRKVIYLKKELEHLAKVDISLFDKLYFFFLEHKKYYNLLKIVLQILIGVSTMSKKMTNDKKTTVAGWVKMIIAAIIAIVNSIWGLGIGEGVQAQIISVIIGIWGLVEYFQAKATNKPDEV